MSWVFGRAAAWARTFSPEARDSGRLLVQGAQFMGLCYCVDQYAFHVSMVRQIDDGWPSVCRTRTARRSCTATGAHYA